MVFGLADIQMRRRFIDQEEGGEERRRREHKRLDTLVAYCEAPECRRQNLLIYFGEEFGPCGNCDVCLDPAETVDGSDEARWVLEAITLHRRTLWRGAYRRCAVGQSQRQGGAACATIRLPVFGIGKAHGRQHWQSLMRQMVGGGFLSIDVAGFGGIGITPKGRALINGEGEFRYRRDVRAADEEGRARPAAGGGGGGGWRIG